MLYFAYGSNLSLARLTRRVPSAKLVSTGRLNKHRLCFHKVGRDGSAKCDAFYTGIQDDSTLGAVFRIHSDHKQSLDRAEGLGNGYEIKNVTVLTDLENVTAFTYYATNIDNSIKPFHWYKKHVLLGAKEHCFPEHYINRISEIVSINDFDIDRMEREAAIHKR